jgi:hypothetical protein
VRAWAARTVKRLRRHDTNLLRRAAPPVNTTQRSFVVLLRGQALDQRMIFVDHTELGGAAR